MESGSLNGTIGRDYLTDEGTPMTASTNSSTKMYQYPRKYQFILNVVSMVWLMILILTFYGAVQVAISLFVMMTVAENANFLWQGIASIVGIVAVITTSCLFALAISLTIFPTISTTTNGFRVHSRIGKSSLFDWQAIHSVRKSHFTNSLFIGIKGLGPLYWPTGLLWWLGTGGIQIGPHISDHDELLQILRKRRPDLFT